MAKRAKELIEQAAKGKDPRKLVNEADEPGYEKVVFAVPVTISVVAQVAQNTDKSKFEKAARKELLNSLNYYLEEGGAWEVGDFDVYDVKMKAK